MSQCRDDVREQQIGAVYIPPSIMCLESLTLTQKVLWGRIQGLATKEGYCYASNIWIGGQIGLNKGTVSNNISILVHEKHVKRVIIRDAKGKIIERRLYPLLPDLSTEELIPINGEIDIPINGEIDTPINEEVEGSIIDKSNTEKKDTSPNGDELCSDLPFEHPQTRNEYAAATIYILTHNLADWYEYVAERHGKHKGWLRGVFACGVHGFNGEAPASIEECERLYQAVLAAKKFPSPPKKQGSAVGYYRELIRRCKAGEMGALDESWVKKEG